MSLRPFRDIKRKRTKVIHVGKVKVGGDNPISVQSMTNTLTTDVKATIKQINEIQNEGADLVRVSCPDESSSKALKEISKHVDIPIIADIHFHYKRAIEAASNGASCLRINPGNIGNEKKIQDVLLAAKDNNCSIRIGVNAGSLEKDILEKYKEPCPEALVESAIRNIKILEDKDLDDLISNMRADVLSSTFEAHIPEYEIETNWKVDELTNILESEFNLQFNLKVELENSESNTQEVLNRLLDFADKIYLEKRNKFPNVYSQLENQIILQVIDQSWKNHINQLDSLRQNIGFRSYAGKDPRLEYKREAFEMFEQLLETIKKESTRFLCRVEVKPEDEQEIEKMKSREVLEKTKTVHENSPSAFMDNSVSNQQVSNNDQPVEGNRRLRRLQAKANRKKKKR